jgi:hypothetical protein
LRIESQLGIGFQGWIFSATVKNQHSYQPQRNGRYPPQMSIMFCSAAF